MSSVFEPLTEDEMTRILGALRCATDVLKDMSEDGSRKAELMALPSGKIATFAEESKAMQALYERLRGGVLIAVTDIDKANTMMESTVAAVVVCVFGQPQPVGRKLDS